MQHSPPWPQPRLQPDDGQTDACVGPHFAMREGHRRHHRTRGANRRGPVRHQQAEGRAFGRRFSGNPVVSAAAAIRGGDLALLERGVTGSRVLASARGCFVADSDIAGWLLLGRLVT